MDRSVCAEHGHAYFAGPCLKCEIDSLREQLESSKREVTSWKARANQIGGELHPLRESWRDLTAQYNGVCRSLDEARAEVERLTMDNTRLLREEDYADARADEYKDERDTANARTGELEARHTLANSCASCGSSLIEQDTVPHCLGCATTEDEDEAWLDARALLAALDTEQAKGEG